MHLCFSSSRLTSVVCVTLVLLAACSGHPGDQRSPSPSPAPSRAYTPIMTHTSPLPSATHRPSPTATPTTATSTPLPTLADEEREGLLQQLIRENQGCRLPCWWGFTPGETTWETVQDFTLMLGMDVSLSSSRDAIAVYVARNDVTGNASGTHQRYVTEDGIVEKIQVMAKPAQYGDTLFMKTWDSYLLPGIFETYGEPEEVRLLAFGRGPIYYLLVSYLDQGFLAYYSGQGIMAGENIRLCPAQGEFILLMWPPGKFKRLEAVILQPNPDFHPVEDHFPIQEVTNMSTKDFFAVFNGAGVQTCFETPRDLW
ncbi:MAG: hypothetical protein JXB07_11495 [Anaerolineae bacterium]|nr:hypothetical protein [Anaerolineae bacterium]